MGYQKGMAEIRSETPFEGGSQNRILKCPLQVKDCCTIIDSVMYIYRYTPKKNCHDGREMPCNIGIECFWPLVKWLLPVSPWGSINVGNNCFQSIISCNWLMVSVASMLETWGPSGNICKWKSFQQRSCMACVIPGQQVALGTDRLWVRILFSKYTASLVWS